MRTNILRPGLWSATLLPAALSGVLAASAIVTVAQQPNNEPAQAQSQSGPPGDPIRQLNLTAEQVEKVRAIREQSKDERLAINQRLRTAQRALDEAIESDGATEALIDQRARELAEAQVASIRMRAVTEMRIRRVLTPEQLTKLRDLRQRALSFREGQRIQRGNDQMRPPDRMQRRRNALQRDGNFRPDAGPRARPDNLPVKQRP